ncbi:hypothetical protein QVM41_28145 [Pseudomonas shirazica]|uniref:hypothetical protein n=1 Tax=Pseudomonas shirazica TaxID=1940636 RepID=UPI003525617F
MPDPFAHHLRLKRPCANCPFLKEGAIELAPGRLDGIIEGLLEDDHSTFQCHKTVHSRKGGEWDEDGNYTASGHEAMCAGAAAYLMKNGSPSVAMRIAFATGAANPGDWNDAKPSIID